ncbi:Uncharacterised protein [Acinetobacter baumannii]|nr:Uncharacterised protein [Acinetobacter baumannii]
MADARHHLPVEGFILLEGGFSLFGAVQAEAHAFLQQIVAQHGQEGLAADQLIEVADGEIDRQLAAEPRGHLQQAHAQRVGDRLSLRQRGVQQPTRIQTQHDAVDARMAAMAADQFEQGVARPGALFPQAVQLQPFAGGVDIHRILRQPPVAILGRPDVHRLLQAIVLGQQEAFAAFADQRGFAAARRPDDQKPRFFADVTARQAVFEALPRGALLRRTDVLQGAQGVVKARGHAISLGGLAFGRGRRSRVAEHPG